MHSHFFRTRSHLQRIEFYKLTDVDVNLLQLAAEWHHEKWTHIKCSDIEDTQTEAEGIEESKEEQDLAELAPANAQLDKNDMQSPSKKWKYIVKPIIDKSEGKNTEVIKSQGITIEKQNDSMQDRNKPWSQIVGPKTKNPNIKKHHREDVEERKQYFIKMTEDPQSFYIVTCAVMGACVPVGMFTLKRERGDFCLAELDDVYIDKSYRDLGFGSLIIEAAKKIAHDEGARGLELDVLNPYPLDKFYKKRGSHVVAEGMCFGFPTEKHIIDFDHTEEEQAATRESMINLFRSTNR